MTDSISFKAYLKRDGQEVEVRRFAIDGGAATNYIYLRGKIEAMFPSVQNDQFDVYWQDNDKDYIVISSDEELLEALSASSVQPLKLYIQVRANQQTGGGSSPQTHVGVTCDGCEGPVTGFRYKCVTCPDYDLCATCETSGVHSEHFMLRMPTPVGGFCHPKMFRKFFGRPHKFHKRHGWGRMADTMFAESRGPTGTGPGPCPFSRRERPAQAMAGMTDMFDFSALLEFINSLGVTASPASQREASATAQAATTSQAQPSQASASQEPPQSSSAPGQSQERTSQPQPTEYLNGIGQAIAAFLDPFGIDVTFDVRAKPPGAQDEPAASTSTEQSTPAAPATPPSASLGVEIPSQPPTPPTEAAAAAISVTEATLPPQASSSTAARRNSDDWTLLNRESPTRTDVVAMDVDEARGAKPKSPAVHPLYPELPKDAPSAPPPTDSAPVDSDRQRIQEAIESIRSMGFEFETTLLRELLRRENCDIASVLEMILSNSGKK